MRIITLSNEPKMLCAYITSAHPTMTSRLPQSSAALLIPQRSISAPAPSGHALCGTRWRTSPIPNRLVNSSSVRVGSTNAHHGTRESSGDIGGRWQLRPNLPRRMKVVAFLCVRNRPKSVLVKYCVARAGVIVSVRRRSGKPIGATACFLTSRTRGSPGARLRNLTP